MEKPITLRIEETTQGIVQILNESQLPFFILNNIIKELHDELNDLSKKQAEHDKQEYYKSLQVENSNNTDVIKEEND